MQVEGGRLLPGEAARLGFTLRINRRYLRVYVQVGIASFGGQTLLVEGLTSTEHPELLEPGEFRVILETSPLWLMPRSYTARIKVLADPADGSQARFTSDWAPIAVEGDELGCSHPSAILAPAVVWSVTPESKKEISGNAAAVETGGAGGGEGVRAQD